jgi:hypothetical protein
MTWAPITTESALLLFSVLAGTIAAVILVRDIVRSRPQRTSYGGLALPGQSYGEPGNRRQWSRVLDRVTLLNRNLIQCPRCSAIEHAYARFCTRCGTSMLSRGETLACDMPDVKARYYASDESTRVYALSMNVDPQTRIGVLIGIQNQGVPERIHATQN